MLEGKNICVSFGKQAVLQNVSIQLNEGERGALLGPSGAGKSTLLRILSGIQVPNSGVVSYSGIAPQYEKRNFQLGLNRKWIWPKVCLIFQDLQLFPNLTGFENCVIGLEDTSQSSTLRIEELAERLKVTDCLKKTPNKMSQGEQQRIAIIRGLVRNPQFLLMDEPTSALDPITRKELVKLLVEISEAQKMGLLIATHDWELARELTHTFILIRNGKLEFFDTIMDATSAMAGIS